MLRKEGKYVYPTKVKAKKTVSKPKKTEPTRKVSKTEERKDGTVGLFSTVALLAGEKKSSIVAKEVEKLQEKIDAGDTAVDVNLNELFKYGPNYEDLVSLVRKDVESTTDTGNFVTSSDRSKAIDILNTSNKRKLSSSERAMYDYLSGRGRLEDALVAVAFERGEDASGSDLNVEFTRSKALTLKENLLYAGTGGKNSRLAEEWILANLSDTTRGKYDQLVTSYAEKIILTKGWLVRGTSKIKEKKVKGADSVVATKRLPSKDTLAGTTTTFTPEQIKAYEASPEGKARTKVAQEKFVAGVKLGEVEPEIFKKIQANIDAERKKIRTSKKFKELQERITLLSNALTISNLDKDIVDDLNLPSNAVSQLAVPLHPDVIKALLPTTVNGELVRGDLRLALSLMDGLSKGAPKDYRELISAIAKTFPMYLSNVKVEIVANLKNNLGADVAGFFDATTNTIKLDSVEGMNSHVVLHELSHAILNPVLSNKSHPTTKQLDKLFKETREILDTEDYGTTTLKEFVSEALSNMGFRNSIAGVYPKGGPINSFRKFINIVIDFLNKILSKVGLGRKKDMVSSGIKIPSLPIVDTESSILSSVGKIVEAFLAPRPNALGITERNNQTAPQTALSDIEKVQKAIVESGGTRQDFTDRVLETFGSVSNTTKEIVLKTQDSQDVAVLAEKYDLGRVGYDIFETMLLQRGDIQLANDKTKVVVDKYLSWQRGLRGNKLQAMKDLDMLIYSGEFGATIWQVNPLLNKKAALQRYANDPKKIEIWNKQQPYVRRLKANGGMKIYKLMRDHYVDSYKQMQKVMEGRIDEVLGSTPEGIKAAKRLKQEVFTKLFDKSLLDVYFPLTREGRYKVPFTFKQAVGANEDPFAMLMVTTNNEAKRLVSQLEADPNVEKVFPIIYGKYDSKTLMFEAPSSSFISQIVKTINDNSGNTPEAKELVDNIMDLYITSLPETSFAKSLQNRKNTPGFIIDSLYALKTKGFDIPVQTVRLEYSARLTQLADIVKENYVKAVAQKKNKDRTVAIALIRDRLIRDTQFASNPPTGRAEDIAKYMNQYAFIQSIWLNVSSAAIQLGQIPFVVHPFLAGSYGWSKSGNALMNATGLVFSSVNLKSLEAGIDNYVDLVKVGKKQEYRIKPTVLKNLSIGVSKKEAAKRIQEMENLLPLITYALSTGQLNRTFLQDTLNIADAGRERKGGKVNNAVEIATSVGAAMFNVADRINRQVTMVAAYQLELQKLQEVSTDQPQLTRILTLEQMQNAAKKAMYIATQTNGGVFLETGPEIAKKHFFRVASMYKTYGFKMNTLQANLGVAAIKTIATKGNTLEDKFTKNEALKQFIYTQLHTALLLGVKGMPIFGVVAAIALYDELMYPEEETLEEDLQRRLDKLYPGTDLFYKGLINFAFDVDITDRAKLNSLIVQNNQLVIGPAGSVVIKSVEGAMMVAKGEVERGIEKMIPPGLANNWKASPFGRLSREGYVSRKGHPIYSDVTTGELVLQFFGFRPSTLARISENNARLNRISKAVTKKRMKLYDDYYNAIESDNEKEIEEVIANVAAFNDKEGKRFPMFFIKNKDLNDSYRRKIKAGKERMHNGLYFPKWMIDLIQENQAHLDSFSERDAALENAVDSK